MIFKPQTEPILTVPDQIKEHGRYCLTGNEYLSLPRIGQDGAIDSINILSLSGRGLLEFKGAAENPFLFPQLAVNEQAVELNGNLSWRYDYDWLPAFRFDSAKFLVEGEIIAPPGFKGFFYTLTLKNLGVETLSAKLGWRGNWKSFNYIIFKSKNLAVTRSFSFDQWTKSLILEASAGLPLAATAMATEPETRWIYNQKIGLFSSDHQVDLETGQYCTVTLYVAVNLEGDGAGTAVLDLRRRGTTALGNAARNWLNKRYLKLSDSALNSTLNRNLFFCYYYALGRSLDSDELVAITSRSPLYYVSAAFWSRDCLLWSFPAIMISDRLTARELLVTVFRRHTRNAGDHAHYINGTVLYPGFELDQLAAYFIALEYYLRQSGDYAILDEDVIRNGLKLLIEKTGHFYDPESGLYSTFLDPSDDPVTYPFLTYCNALLQRAFSFLATLQTKKQLCHDTDFTASALELEHAVFRHCTVKGPCGLMFAWAVDGKGRFSLYDNPPGSLQLLAHYGFCSADHAVFKNTVHWIRSSNNSYFHQGVNFEEAGSLHAGNPWPLGACNDLLNLNNSALDFFRRAEMDNGYFCETIDPETGRVSTGAAFASAAGFMAHALDYYFRKQELKTINSNKS